MKKLLLYGGRFLTLASLVFLILTFQKHFAEIPRFALNAMSVSGLLATIAFVMMCSGLGSYAWVVLMRGARIVLPFRLAYVILGKSQIRKYLPGNIFHYLARLTEGKRYGLATEPIILSTGVETLIAAGTAAMVGVAGLYWFEESTDFDIESLVYRNHSAALILLLIISVGVIGAFYISPASRRWVTSRFSFLRLNIVLPPMILFAIMDVFIGFFITLLLKGIWGIVPPWAWYRYSWGFTLAWLLGFVMPGASGGIGVREAVIVGLFGSSLGTGVAAGLAIVLRLITVVGDLLTFTIASLLDDDRAVKS